jgi:hypothetical protein
VADGLLDRMRDVWRRELVEADPVDFALRLTLVYLLIDELKGPWFGRVIVLVAGGVGLLMRQHRSPWVWGPIAMAMAAKAVDDWLRVDNHSWLTTWWTLAIWLSLVAREPRAMAVNGRLLVGLCMAFATVWKAWLTPDFMSGDFFHHNFIWDLRFSQMASVIGSIDLDLLAANRHLAQSQLTAVVPEPVTLHSAPVLATVARGLAWATVLIEGSLAVGFLLPGRAAWLGFRDWLLIAFCYGTYAIAPVAGFGALLAILGLAQCPARRVWTRAGYLSAFVVVYLHDWVPWRDWLVAMTGG